MKKDSIRPRNTLKNFLIKIQWRKRCASCKAIPDFDQRLLEVLTRLRRALVFWFVPRRLGAHLCSLAALKLIITKRKNVDSVEQFGKPLKWCHLGGMKCNYKQHWTSGTLVSRSGVTVWADCVKSRTLKK